MNSVKDILNRYILEPMALFFPKFCYGCNEIVQTNGLCRDCWSKLTFLTDGVCERCNYRFEFKMTGLCGHCATTYSYIDRSYTVLQYNEIAGKILIKVKNFYHLDSLSFFAPFVPKNTYDVIVPVPLHYLRLIWRGYNQSKIIAQLIDGNIDESCLTRIRWTKVGMMDKRKRVDRVQNAFKASNVTNKSILLVDDVVTTGSTVEECAKTLKQAGASRVDIFTLARR